jgi:hypothetical protein
MLSLKRALTAILGLISYKIKEGNMSDRIIDNSELIVERFPCGCNAQDHSLDVTIEVSDITTLITFNLYMAGKSRFRYRLKQAWRALRGYDGQLCDFILRLQDAPRLIDLLSQPVISKYTE